MKTKVVETKLVSVDISGLHDPMEIWRPYTMHATGTLIPDRVDLRWERENYESWELVRASVSGFRVKRSGETGIAPATTWFTLHRRDIQQEFPLWLQELVTEWKPFQGSVAPPL